jgi:predicted RNase H-like HicB family nuclease
MKEEIIVNEKNQLVIASLLVNFFKEENFFVAECRSLGIITYGNSLDHTKKMFNEALAIWREDVFNSGNLKEALLSLGWKINKFTVMPKEETYKVSIPLIANKHINLKIPLSALH